MNPVQPLLCQNGQTLLICTKSHPKGLMVADFARSDSREWIDYYRGDGVLLDGRQFRISGSCDHRGWHYSISIEGNESDGLLNPEDTFGRPGGMGGRS
jgi:hypothetical protein